MKTLIFLFFAAAFSATNCAAQNGDPAAGDHTKECSAISAFITITRADIVIMQVSGPADRNATAAQFDKSYPEMLKRAEFSPDLRSALKEYVIAVKAFMDGQRAAQKMDIDRANASLDIEMSSACGPK